MQRIFPRDWCLPVCLRLARYKKASNLLYSVDLKMSDTEMEKDDFDVNKEEQQEINIPPRKARQSVIQFVESAVRRPPTYSKEEASRPFAQEKINREKVIKAEKRC